MTANLEKLKKYCLGELCLSQELIDFLRLYANNEATPEDLAAYYKTIQFDKLGGQHVCALAELSRRMEYQGVPRELVPRVRGILRYYTTWNAKQLQGFYWLSKLLNENGIDSMLMKGGAMKAYYMPRAIRYMGDIDFCVKQEDFDRVCKLAKDTGECETYASITHLTVERGEQKMDIHSSFFKTKRLQKEEAVFWKDAREIVWQGQKVYVPSPEHLLVLILANMFQDTIQGNDYKSPWMRWLTDVIWLMEQYSPDWEKIRMLCCDYNLTLAVKIMLLIMNEIVPGSVTEVYLDRLQIDKKTVKYIPIMFRMRKAYRKCYELENNKNITYLWWVFLRIWYYHRFIGDRCSLWADITSFPSYIKETRRCKTWREWWKKSLPWFRSLLSKK